MRSDAFPIFFPHRLFPLTLTLQKTKGGYFYHMTKNSFAKGFFACFFCISILACCQFQAAAQSTVEIVECESSGCTPGSPGSPTWSFSGSQGVGHFGTGNQPLTIEHIDSTTIAVRRADRTGPATGLVALYMGRIEGQAITGSVIYYDGGRTNAPRTNAWNGILRGSPAGLRPAVGGNTPRFPFTLRECESNRCLQSGTPYPIIWTFPSRNGQGWVGDHPRSMVLEDLAPGFLLARRIDGPALGGLTALYFGEITGKHITGGVIYFDRDRPNQPRSDTWFGELQDTFTQEDAMNTPPPPNSSPNTAPPPSNGSNTSNPAMPAQMASVTGYPPPPEGVPTVIGNRPKIVDFNGQWEGYYASPGIPTAIQIRHNGTHIEAELLKDDLSATGTTFFKGEFEPRSSIADVQVLDMNGFSAFTGATSGNYHADKFGTIDFDHVAIQGHQPFQRLSLPSYNDIPCSSANETGVKAEWAYMRAVVDQRAKDMPSAVCWLYIAATQGDARAAFYLAYCLHDGNGTAANLPQASQWARVSAEKGNEYGAYLVGLFYEHGDGVAQSAANARYWRQRGDEIKKQKADQAKAEKQREEKETAEVLPLAAMSLIGMALLADEMTSDHLCDKPSYPMSYSQRASYQAVVNDRLREKGMHCEDEVEVPNSR